MLTSKANEEEPSLSGRMLFAVPKKGRLSKETLELLRGANILFKREDRLDVALVTDLPIALVFLPAADIPTFISKGKVDLGITILDQVQEHEAASQSQSGCDVETMENRLSGIDIVLRLGYGDCQLQLQVPDKGRLTHSTDLIGCTIGTSFVHLTRQYFTRLEAKHCPESFRERGLQTQIMELTGSVEAACALGVTDGAVGLVESGATIKAVGLRAIDTITESTAVLIKRRSKESSMIDLVVSRIKGAIAAKRYIMCQYNIEKIRLPAAIRIASGKQTATVTALVSRDGLALA